MNSEWFVLCIILSIFPTALFQQTLTVSERSEQQVRFLCAAGSGVWTSCRLDPTLRLFDWSTGRPLQDVDLTPLVTKTLGRSRNRILSSWICSCLYCWCEHVMAHIEVNVQLWIHFLKLCFNPYLLNPKTEWLSSWLFGSLSPPGPAFLSLSPLQISSLTFISGRLWVGTGSGAIFSIPVSLSEYWPLVPRSQQQNDLRDNALTLVTSQLSSSLRSIGSESASIPYCSLAAAQLCYHGHRQAVKFIIAAPGENLLSLFIHSLLCNNAVILQQGYSTGGPWFFDQFWTLIKDLQKKSPPKSDVQRQNDKHYGGCL